MSTTADATPAPVEPPPKTLVQEFLEFIARGNALDLAVGLVVGGAFQKIVTSIVNDLIMPPIGAMLGDKSFEKLSVELRPAIPAQGDVAAKPPIELKYGAFITNVIEFFIIAASVFVVVKVVNAMMAYRLPFLHSEEIAAAGVEKKEEKK